MCTLRNSLLQVIEWFIKEVKNRLAKYLVPIIQEYIDGNNIKTYIEPFCGSCSIIEKIKCDNRIASDINNELIALLRYVQSDPELSIAPDAPTIIAFSSQDKE